MKAAPEIHVAKRPMVLTPCDPPDRAMVDKDYSGRCCHTVA